MPKKIQKNIFTILYEVNAQKYLIGVTNEVIPTIAALGVNTTRPLPRNIRTALVESVKELRRLNQEPKVIDYNAPSNKLSSSVLSNFSVAPLTDYKAVKSVPEALAELKAKMMEGNK